jgi:hypothetical protein
MKISGPHRNKARGNWYLSYSTPKLDANGVPQLTAEGQVIRERHRPHYVSKALAEADKPAIAQQYATAGSGSFTHSRAAQADYDAARQILPAGVTMTLAAQFYRQHNPRGVAMRLDQARTDFLKHIEALHGKDRHYQDLDWRTAAFVASREDRAVASITRKEAMAYLLGRGGAARSQLNHKRALCSWFNWLVEQEARMDNPFGGIKRKKLPKILAKEIEFLPIERVEAYLRAAETYDPELVAHEVVQLFAGVRADDEMADFRGEWVKAATREVVTPATTTKTGVREVIDGLEENFWAWWAAYGREGVLRPKNYKKRFWRIRILAQVADEAERARLARLTTDGLRRVPEARALLGNWPWNARRRTFCTYHVAKHQSAAKTALILRQRSGERILHASYRGLGVTAAQGAAYFALMPAGPASPAVEA